jgi:pyrimidine deaminase RibD-like protein
MNEKDREFMQLAIEEAAHSEWGSETDPKVGAVVVKDGEFVDSAHRGEQAKGDHAEFTVLHKKIRSKDLTEGAILYTTLEPCTTRSHDKLPCAGWIVRKGIRRVVIGILDPNPNICGKGYWRLVDAGIEVEFFPFDLARQIIELNRPFIQEHQGGARVAPAFAREVSKWKNRSISPYVGLGWRDALSLQDCPNLREGWSLDQVVMRINEAEPFVLPKEYEPLYREFFQCYYEEKDFKDDNENLMLKRNPIAFSDKPSLVLEVTPTKYSLVQFYCNQIAPREADRGVLIADLVQGSLKAKFANSLCMQMVVVTSESKLLVTRRSPKVNKAYYPRTWSVSVEEQLSREDFENGPERAALSWASRLLREELGLHEDYYHPDNIRLLSVFLEADILNTAVCTYAELRIDAPELDAILQGLARTDYEFTEWTFLDLNRTDLLRQLFRPRKEYHPATGFRLLYTLLKRFGSPSDTELCEVIGRP